MMMDEHGIDPSTDGLLSGDQPDRPTPPRVTPFRRHPVRWSVAAGGLAAVLALGGYGVTQAATSTGATTSAGALSRTAGKGFAGGPPTGGSAPSGSSQAGESHSATGSAGGPAVGGGTVGKVAAITGATITLRSPGGTTVTVTVTSSTVFKDGTNTVSKSSLKVGQFAVVTGTTAKDGAVSATTVTFGATPAAGPAS
jgi:hypothetical protein